MIEKRIKFEDIFTFNKGAFELSCDHVASQKKLDEALTTYRAQVLEEVKAHHDAMCKKGDCVANSEGQYCCVETYLKHPTN